MIVRIHWFIAAISLALLGAGCSQGSGLDTTNVAQMQVTSTAFDDGQPIPQKYTGQGDDVSPPLVWSGAPPQTKSFALICQDPDAPGGTFTHWIIWDISASATGLSEGEAKQQFLPDASAQGKNSFGNFGYNGPNPPAGKVHHYIFKVYALDTLTLGKVTSSASDFDSLLKGHVLASGQLTGTYQSQ
jgi:Raf kinase inhibitor-like YbhB/YbcL family protein